MTTYTNRMPVVHGYRYDGDPVALADWIASRPDIRGTLASADADGFVLNQWDTDPQHTYPVPGSTGDWVVSPSASVYTDEDFQRIYEPVVAYAPATDLAALADRVAALEA